MKKFYSHSNIFHVLVAPKGVEMVYCRYLQTNLYGQKQTSQQTSENHAVACTRYRPPSAFEEHHSESTCDPNPPARAIKWPDSDSNCVLWLLKMKSTWDSLLTSINVQFVIRFLCDTENTVSLAIIRRNRAHVRLIARPSCVVGETQQNHNQRCTSSAPPLLETVIKD